MHYEITAFIEPTTNPFLCPCQRWLPSAELPFSCIYLIEVDSSLRETARKQMHDAVDRAGWNGHVFKNRLKPQKQKMARDEQYARNSCWSLKYNALRLKPLGMSCTLNHNRGSQIPLFRLLFFSIPPSRPILRPNPDPVSFFNEIFCLIIEIDVI